MELTQQHIEEIAELLECGMVCYFHKPTGEIEWHPDPDNPFFEPEPWEDLFGKIDSDLGNYMRFQQMDSREAFQVMEDFANSLTNASFRDHLLEQLSARKPFQNFKYVIDSSKYRQDWFDFRRQAYIEFVREQF
ncbi:UPF0158 family protein [Algoriphagus sp. NG3]|uniref:UPF0158 family protein n=1 Tax=Algoriphagus sp. NG3 TaxID=3097546 RepID=UPI002A80670E|nr:UPF0158 family protein [Algoriphagus sp. NG3]WPR74760.1 UPF0158 family protein [Algoriphagus sp. NG3]